MKVPGLIVAASLLLSLSASAADLKIGLKKIVGGLTAPSVLIAYNNNQMLLGEQTGKLHLLNQAGKLTVFGDISSILGPQKASFDERGLLGVALHPQFRKNRKLYISYSGPLRAGAKEHWDHTSHVSEFKVTGNKLDLKSERVLLQIDQPYFNHDGGRIAFGPDGMLYIGSGDGGNKNDVNAAERVRKGKVIQHAIVARGPRGNGQDMNVLLGKIIRIDVNKKSAGRQYGIPADNPFVGKKGARPEIWALGIRNPWGLSFDRGGKQELFIADVGQSRWEEINRIVKGGNYGWNLREGNEWFNPKNDKTPLDKPYVGDKTSGFEAPVGKYKNMGSWGPDEGKGRSVTGGYVYRGKAIPALSGKYVFGDWSRNIGPKLGILYALTPQAAGKEWKLDGIGIGAEGDTNLKAFLWAFGQDADGELYVLTNPRNTVASQGKGMVQKLVPLK